MNTVDSSYTRHPDDPADDSIDVGEIYRLIKKRDDARRKRDFKLADSICTKIRLEYGVFLIDQERIWSTNLANVERSNAERNPPSGDYELTGHDYALYKRAGTSVSPLGEDRIHELIAERTRCKLNHDFTRADAIQQQLMDAHVQLDDHKKVWRPDGIRFVPYRYEYTYASDAGPCVSSMPEEEIIDLIGERHGCKISHDFLNADIIRGELMEVGVYLNDTDRLWRADGQIFERRRAGKRAATGAELAATGGTSFLRSFNIYFSSFMLTYVLRWRFSSTAEKDVTEDRRTSHHDNGVVDYIHGGSRAA